MVRRKAKPECRGVDGEFGWRRIDRSPLAAIDSYGQQTSAEPHQRGEHQGKHYCGQQRDEDQDDWRLPVVGGNRADQHQNQHADSG